MTYLDKNHPNNFWGFVNLTKKQYLCIEFERDMEIINNKLRREPKSHWLLNGKAKIKYQTERDAVLRCYEMNMKDSQQFKMVSYKCPVCQAWHIGNSGNELEPKDRDKIRRKYKEVCIKLGGFWS